MSFSLRSSRVASTLALLMFAASAGCGDDGSGGAGGSQQGGGGADSSDGGTGGSGGGMQPSASVDGVSAPTRTTIAITITGDATLAPTDPAAYVVTSDRGDLVIESAAIDATAGVITLTTEKQKLGVSYTLTISATENALDQEGGTFLAADRATFWTSNFADFSEVEVEAVRLGVGENIVIYATPDVPADDVADTIAYFDSQIIPIETQLFHAVPDRDDNGKVVILGLDGHGYYAGYFNPVDSRTAQEAESWGYHSNEMEMLYISTPDIGGSFGPVEVVSHEFQHLLYNEAHDFFTADWPYHNEGLAECAVHAVSGSNDTAAWYYTAAPGLVNGKSLVKWDYANYAQYAQAYVFWTYVASRLGGVSGYGELFNRTGSPGDMSSFLSTQIGETFAETQLDMLTAAWLEEPTGPFGFSGMLSLPAKPQVATMAAPIQLEAFAAVFLPANGNGLSPIGAGVDVVHRGAASTADLDAPFDAAGGVVIALNTVQDSTTNLTESSGTLGAGVAPFSGPIAGPALNGSGATDGKLWMHPPPIKPANRALLRAWRLHAHGF
ncbi:MAG: hypothetical protein U0271_26680 [Polyangiaceae bacterium]